MDELKVNPDGTIDYAGNHYVRERRALAEQDHDQNPTTPVSWWHCYGCDRDFPVAYGTSPRHCQRCGAAVMGS